MTSIGIVGSKREARLKLLSEISMKLVKRGYNVISIAHLGESEAKEAMCGRVMSITTTKSATFVKCNFKLSMDDVKSLIPTTWWFMIVEGLQVDDYVVAASTIDDVREYGANSIAIIPVSSDVEDSITVKEKIVDVDEVVKMIIDRALKDVLNLLAQENCGGCGYENCQELAERVVKGGETPLRCTKLRLPVKVLVNGMLIPLNPFTTKMFTEVVKGLLSILKGVPKSIQKATIDISFN
ncbi:MAG: hypothetical protein N3F04_04870 [Candidatus Nezhaarchaeota archaeon]|nr:hypothetical protein [Candidatus Nezhaarchaeota archaeon]MCX8142084.1 hypothetical protein [Candidatus Nezhaarchaeota archaeon]MDW8050135.1 (Fe-S)-binding protein [Nitrososphaerota archaeon]